MTSDNPCVLVPILGFYRYTTVCREASRVHSTQGGAGGGQAASGTGAGRPAQETRPLVTADLCKHRHGAVQAVVGRSWSCGVTARHGQKLLASATSLSGQGTFHSLRTISMYVPTLDISALTLA